MYLSLTVIVLILACAIIGAFVSAFVGGLANGDAGASAGGKIGLFAGAIIGIGIIVMCQNSEVAAWQYDKAAVMIAADCRMTPLGRAVLKDKIITQAEFWRLDDMSDQLGLETARSRINGEPFRQCATRA